MSDIDNYIPEEQLGFFLRRIMQYYNVIFNENIGESQLTPLQFLALFTVYKLKNGSQKEIIKRSHIDQTTIRGVLERLKSKQLITYHKDLQDQRRTLISITEAGTEILEETIPKTKEIAQLILEPLNETENVAFMLLLKKILDYQVENNMRTDDYL